MSASPDRGLGRPPWLAAAGIAISLVSVAAVVLWASHQPAPELPTGGAELVALGAALVLLAVATLLRAERWRRLALRAGGDIALGESLGITIVGFMGNTVLPVRGGDALRVLLARTRARLGARDAIGTLLAERVLDVAVLLVAFLVVAQGALRGIDAPAGTLLLVLGGAVLLAAALLVALLRARRSHEWAGRLIAFVAPMGAPTRDLLSRYGVAMTALTALIWLVEAGVWYSCAHAVGLDLAPVEALYLLALAAVFVLVPSGPGYAGTLDAAVVVGVRTLGGSGQLALSYLLVLRFVLMVPLTVIGGLLLLVRYGGASMLRSRGRAAT